jgi:hypothetical protein
MVHFVVQFEPKQLDQFNKDFLSDMAISKNSIHVRDGGSIGADKKFLYVRVMGGEDKVNAAKNIFIEKKFGTILPAADADRISQAIDKEEEEAAEGMGALFG